MLTYEGGRLKRDKLLMRGKDFEILSESVWSALLVWYTGSPALPRNVSEDLFNLPIKIIAG